LLHAFACFSDCIELRREIKFLVIAIIPLCQVFGEGVVVVRVDDGEERVWVTFIIIAREVDDGMEVRWL